MNKKKEKTNAAHVADSWEDEVDSSSSENENDNRDNKKDNKNSTSNDDDDDDDNDKTPTSALNIPDGFREPPTTPISPLVSSQTFAYPKIPSYSAYGSGNSPRPSPSPSSGRDRNAAAAAPERRPEKQTAVAGRLIAGALGVRAPKRTEEQRAYDRAVLEQESKRRNREKEREAAAREEEEKAKASVWNE